VDVAPSIGSVISGGADRVAIVWDIRDLTSQHILRGHTSPVTSASINKRTGDMVTLAGVDINVWSISGEWTGPVERGVVSERLSDQSWL
jgi:WD40 repeat protein